VLAAHPAVGRAAVLLREDQPGDQRLVAYAEIRPDSPPEAAELHQYLAERLPGYMMPAVIVPMADFPRTVNGKLDRKALPAPDYTSTDETAEEPRTPAEEVLARLFTEILNVPRVGINDDFFALGGHSLLAIRLIARARAALGAELTIAALFANPTVASLAAHAQSAAGAPRSARPRLAARSRS
jgi:nonribosomal peptide synthetase DhbF